MKGKSVYLIDKNGEEFKLVENLKVASNFFTRFKGLMGTKSINNKEGLLFYPGNQIHMFFMKYPIDVIYCDNKFNILHITRDIKPWKIDKIIKKSYYILEVKSNSIPNKDFIKISIN